MIKNLLIFFLGMFGGLWLIWPGIATQKGWECTNDIIINSEKEPTDSISFLEDLQRKLRLTSAISPKTLLKAENLGMIDKLRILGDACFRS